MTTESLEPDRICAAARWSDVKDLERRLGYTIAELHAIATRALADGDDHERGLLREQLDEEEFGQRSDIVRTDSSHPRKG